MSGERDVYPKAVWDVLIRTPKWLCLNSEAHGKSCTKHSPGEPIVAGWKIHRRGGERMNAKEKREAYEELIHARRLVVMMGFKNVASEKEIRERVYGKFGR